MWKCSFETDSHISLISERSLPTELLLLTYTSQHSSLIGVKEAKKPECLAIAWNISVGYTVYQSKMIDLIFIEEFNLCYSL